MDSAERTTTTDNVLERPPCRLKIADGCLVTVNPSRGFCILWGGIRGVPRFDFLPRCKVFHSDVILNCLYKMMFNAPWCGGLASSCAAQGVAHFEL